MVQQQKAGTAIDGQGARYAVHKQTWNGAWVQFLQQLLDNQSGQHNKCHSSFEYSDLCIFSCQRWEKNLEFTKIPGKVKIVVLFLGPSVSLLWNKLNRNYTSIDYTCSETISVCDTITAVIYNHASSLPLYPGRPILTNFLTSTLTFAGAGWAGASLASLAALRALEQTKHLVHLGVFCHFFATTKLLIIHRLFNILTSYIGWLCKIKRQKKKQKTTYLHVSSVQ